MIAQPTSILWFARHELTLSWRDWMAMMTGGRRVRAVGLFIGIGLLAVILHLIAHVIVTPWLAGGIGPDKQTLVTLTGGGLLFWSVTLSQAMESVTRAYYARSDLDLILSSPASSRRVFAVRTGAIALTSTVLSALLAAPAINVLAVEDGPQWLAAYGVLASVGAFSAALAVLMTIGLFKLVGPRRTRLIAQIIAAVIGAGFIIGIQAVAILSYGTLSRVSVLQSHDLIAMAPDPSSLLWLPARAAMGDFGALAVVMIVGFGSLLAVVAATSSSFGQWALAAASISQTKVEQRGRTGRFRAMTAKQALRVKEWRLLRRDPWLLSQTLMQILYLLPPALLLWRNFGANAGVFVVVIPVLVMASGQLAGGLAWLAISGEDAYDLVVTAPVPPRTILSAKIEAVMSVIVVVIAPLLAIVALSSVPMALLAGLGAMLSSASATAIQLWFRIKASRSLFRRRQVASRTATMAEAFCSISWAGAAATAAAGAWIIALVPALFALGILGVARALSPHRGAV